MYTNAVATLSSCIAHARYDGFPDVEYETRDWSKKDDQTARIKKTQRHTDEDIIVRAMFNQMWGSTALGFGGLGGAAMTNAYTVILQSAWQQGYCVYFGSRFAYKIDRPNEKFFEDIQSQRMRPVCDVEEYEQK